MMAIYKIKRAVRKIVIFLSETQDRYELERSRRWGE